MTHFFANNPDGLDTREEIQERVRAAGGDPMDVDTQEQATFGWSLLNSWEDDPPESRRNAGVFASESELVADALVHDYDVEIEDWPDVPGAPAWYDARR